MILRTNFYKLPMEVLKKRLNDLRFFWWKVKEIPAKRKVVEDALYNAYHAYENRKAIETDPVFYQSLKNAIKVFWNDVPEKYDPLELVGKKPQVIQATEDLAMREGLEKVDGGYLFDPLKFNQTE